MDTRTKIISTELAASAARGMAVAAGLFDVLLAADADRLRCARNSAGLLAVVLPGSGTILSQRARAEMVAALDMVDYVVIAAENGDLPHTGGTVVCLEADHQEQLTWLEDHVRRRQTAA